MRYLIEIYLAAWEWLQDRRGRAAARSEQHDSEEKKLRTFLSQGAVGGALGYFLLSFGFAAQPGMFTGVLLVFLPIILVFGGAWGAFNALFLWFAEVLFGRKLNFVLRAVVAGGVAAVLGVGLFYLQPESRTDYWTVSEILGIAFVIYLPIVLMTGTQVRPGHLIFLGAGERGPRRNVGNWIAGPAGFLLRAVSILGFLQALMMVALWSAASSVDRVDYGSREDLPAIAIAVFYFFLSAYFSIATPRKAFVVPTAILVNLPLIGLLSYVMQAATDEAAYLSYLLLVPICLWAVYTLGRLIAPEMPRLLVNRWGEPMAQPVSANRNPQGTP